MIRPEAARRAARLAAVRQAARRPCCLPQCAVKCAVKWDRNLKPKLAIMHFRHRQTDRQTGIMAYITSRAKNATSTCIYTNVFITSISANADRPRDADRATLLHAKSTISCCTPSVNTRQQESVGIESTLLHRPTIDCF